MQTIVADSSSLIYLSKVEDLLPLLTQVVNLIISEQVYRECTHFLKSKVSPSKDAKQIEGLVYQGKISVFSVPKACGRIVLPKLGEGEKSILELWNMIKADLVMIDDKKGILACKNNDIPFLCAILIPGLLRRYNLLKDTEEVNQYIEKICQVGRYSSWIIAYAKECIFPSQKSYNFHGD